VRIAQYEHDEGHPRSAMAAREGFLTALSINAPAAVDDLASAALPSYERLHNHLTTPRTAREFRRALRNNFEVSEHVVTHVDLRKWEIVGIASSSHYPELLELRMAVERWARMNGLGEPWLCDAALQTLSLWNASPAAQEARAWEQHSFVRGAQIEPHETSFTFGTSPSPTDTRRGYNPFDEDRTSARQRLETEFRSELTAYLDRMDELAVTGGGKRVAKSKSARKHYTWLVQYQVLGWNLRRIAEESGDPDPEYSGRTTVATAVRETARAVGITPRRPEVGGRPRKS